MSRYPIAGFIYLISDGEYIKIGYSLSHPTRRMATLQIGNSRNLTLLAFFRGSPALERALHLHYKDHRVRGEWFKARGLSGLVYEAKRGRWDA